MKTTQVFISLLLISLATIKLNGQSNKNDNKSKKTEAIADGSLCYDGTSRILNVGFGFGGFNLYRSFKGSGYKYHSTPALSISYEQALPKKIGPGFIGLGGYLGFQTASAKYSDNNYYYNGNIGNYTSKFRWSNYLLAARASYHLDDLISSNTELYGGLMVGMRFQHFRFSTTNPDPSANLWNYNSGELYRAISLFVGGRYYFSKELSAFGEAGYGLSWITLGISYKL